MFLHPVIVLTLLNRIARYVCTYNPCVQQQQIKIKMAKKREDGLLLEENQSSSLRNRLSSEGNREYNKQEEFKRAERKRQSRRRAQQHHHTLARTTPFEIAAPIYHFENISPRRGMVLPRKQQAKERHLNSYVLMIDEPRLGMENTKFFSPRVFTTREILQGCLSFRARRNV